MNPAKPTSASQIWGTHLVAGWAFCVPTVVAIDKDLASDRAAKMRGFFG
jgi:hypothetical protein